MSKPPADIQIDSDVEIPPWLSGRVPAPSRVYPFDRLSDRDSFFLAEGKEGGTVLMSRVCAASAKYGKRHGKKFTVRKVVEKDCAGVRVWRVAVGG